MAGASVLAGAGGLIVAGPVADDGSKTDPRSEKPKPNASAPPPGGAAPRLCWQTRTHQHTQHQHTQDSTNTRRPRLSTRQYSLQQARAPQNMASTTLWSPKTRPPVHEIRPEALVDTHMTGCGRHTRACRSCCCSSLALHLTSSLVREARTAALKAHNTQEGARTGLRKKIIANVPRALFIALEDADSLLDEVDP